MGVQNCNEWKRAVECRKVKRNKRKMGKKWRWWWTWVHPQPPPSQTQPPNFLRLVNPPTNITKQVKEKRGWVSIWNILCRYFKLPIHIAAWSMVLSGREAINIAYCTVDCTGPTRPALGWICTGRVLFGRAFYFFRVNFQLVSVLPA